MAAKAGTYIEPCETAITATAADTCCGTYNNANFGLPQKSAPKTDRRSNNSNNINQSSLVFSTSSNVVGKESKSGVSTIVATPSNAETSYTAGTNSVSKGSNSDDGDDDADCLLEIKEDTFGKRRVSGKKSGTNSSNNSSRNSNNNKNYSKIFRQYLPSSLNLNYTLSSNRSKCSNNNNNTIIKNNQERPPREIATGENQSISKCSSPASLSSPSSSSTLSPSIINAFNLFKLSSSSPSSSLKCDKEIENNKQIRSNSQSHQQDLPSKGSSSLLFGAFHPGHNKIGLSESHKLISKEVKQDSDKIPRQEVNYPHKQNQNLDVKVKRRGFLYLKTKNKKGNSVSHLDTIDRAYNNNEYLSNQRSTISSNKSSLPSPPLSNKPQRSSQEDRRISIYNIKQKDLNNNYHSNYNQNSISSLLSSSANQYDEHKTCLLEEEEEEDEDEEVERNSNSNNKHQLARLDKQLKSFQTINSRDRMSAQNYISQEVSSAKNDAYSPKTSTIDSKNSNNKTMKKDSQKLTLVAGCLLTLTIFASLILTQGKLTLAQLQPSAPFRSQSSSPINSINQPLSSQAVSSNGAVPSSPNSIQGNSVSSNRANLSPPQPAAGSLVANINCNKIRGHVTFTPNIRGGGTTVTTQITAGPPGEVYQWSIHQFPVKPGAAMCSCSPLILGTKLVDLSEMHGNLPSDQEFNVQSSLNLFGFDSPVGHSLMLRGMKTGMVACATFLPTSRKSNYRAKFHTPISGSVTIFQTAFGTSFISHLMYSNGTRRHSQHRFDLVKSEDDIVTTSLLSGVQAGSAGSTSGRLENNFALLEQREHDNELSQCKRFNNGEALLRNMTYQLAISTENFGMRGRTSLVLPRIPFETFSSVYIIVYSEHDPNEPIACAPLKFVKPKTAAAKFQSVSVQGSVVFSQDSPYDVTIARINLNMPNSDGHSYGIDELPMIIRRKSDTRVCPNIREIIYNPHHVEPSSVPLEGEATSDQYAVGDLSGKYGSLTGKSSEKIQVNDYNLPLFGPISIVGRAMTIYSAEGVAIACSNVELTTQMTTAFATFDYGIQGQFIFRQPVDDCNGDTYVYIEVSKPVSGGASTSTSSIGNNHEFRSLDHNWHIHVNPVDSGLDHLSTTDCLPAGPHYNPYNTSTSNIYSRDCTPFNVLRCELGDLSAKMFTIDIPPYRVKGGQEPDIGKFFGTDIDLPLCGPVSVVNRSVVVHVQDFGSQRLACSTVIEFKPRTS